MTTPVSFVTTAHAVIRGLLMADWVTIGQYIYWNGPKRAGLITASDQTVWAVHSCNSWYMKVIKNSFRLLVQ